MLSSWNASAYGRPNSSTDVQITHRLFPPNMTTFEVPLYVVEAMFESFERVWGGIMSRRAVMRSKRVSSMTAASPMSEASLISESANVCVSVDGCNAGCCRGKMMGCWERKRHARASLSSSDLRLAHLYLIRKAERSSYLCLCSRHRRQLIELHPLTKLASRQRSRPRLLPI